MTNSHSPQISVVVPCHAEGILIHKTLLSINRAVAILPGGVNIEILLHLDNPSPSTLAYADQAKNHFKNISIYTNQFGDPGKSRDFCIQRATGKYIALIDGDDLMSENWLSKAYDELEGRPYGTCVAHSEMTVEFGGFNSVVQKYGSINQTTDSLLNVWSARWNSIIFAPSTVLKAIGYPSNTAGYGYEDWLISCTFIEQGLDNVLIPETVMFVRRKETDSVWDTMRANWLVLPSTKILSFENIRTIKLPREFLPSDKSGVGESSTAPFARSLIYQSKKRIKGSRLEPYARKAYSRLLRASAKLTTDTQSLPDWLLEEWRHIHSIERQIFPTKELIQNSKTYHSITDLHYRMGGAYHKAVSYTRQDEYDYILFVPWLISGGADSFAINYANATAEYNTNKKVLVVATMQGGARSIWQEKLNDRVDYIPLNDICDTYDLDSEHQNRLIEQLVENSHATHLHILNSIAGYDFVRKHKEYLRSTGKKIVATSFSESTDDSKRVFGFSHTHVPYVYEYCDYITTDNSVVRDMWINLYGFDKDKILLHRPMIDVRAAEKLVRPHKGSAHKAKKVLWAARLAPEKLPEIVPKIGKLIPNVEIDMYGTIDVGYKTKFIESLPSNVHYRGSYNGFFSLDTEHYSAYLYTSLFDGLPNTLIEASVARLPIVASKAGGIADFINDKTGVLIKDVHSPEAYAEGINKLLLDSQYAHDVSANAYQELFNGYDPASHFERISHMLKQLDY